MALPAHSGPRPLIQFRNHFSQTAGLLGRVISPSQGRYLSTGQHKHKINAYTHQTSMPWVRFEHTIPASERAKTVHALDCAATVAGFASRYRGKRRGATFVTIGIPEILLHCVEFEPFLARSYRTLYIFYAQMRYVKLIFNLLLQ
jgi:hypothetical protein